MYFFRIDISSFDDAEKTLFVIPEQTADEQGIPFDEKILTQTAEYKAFIKENATSMVDGEYTQFECEEILENINEEVFKRLLSEGKIKQLDNNGFSISTGFKPKKSGGKKDMKMYLIIGAAALVLVVMLIVSATAGRGGNSEDLTTSVESTESSEITDSSDSADNSDISDSTTSSDNSSEDSNSEQSESTSSSVYVDEPPTEPPDSSTTDENGYTNVGYRPTTNSSSGGQSGVYEICRVPRTPRSI